MPHVLVRNGIAGAGVRGGSRHQGMAGGISDLTCVSLRSPWEPMSAPELGWHPETVQKTPLQNRLVVLLS